MMRAIEMDIGKAEGFGRGRKRRETRLNGKFIKGCTMYIIHTVIFKRDGEQNMYELYNFVFGITCSYTIYIYFQMSLCGILIHIHRP